MLLRAHSRRWKALAGFGFLFAVLGMVSQLAVGSLVLPGGTADAQIAALATAGVDCDASSSSAPGHRVPHRHHQAEPSFCPLRLALEMPGYTLLPPIVVPKPASVTAVRSGMPPPSRGPPPATARVGRPRAPPTQA